VEIEDLVYFEVESGPKRISYHIMYVLLVSLFFIYYDYANYTVTLVKLLHGARWIITPVSESWRPP
jgi:hypothetical protein